ncbi:hypothetical protein PMIN06_003028 [Paraphaeosphaeria minitans]
MSARLRGALVLAQLTFKLFYAHLQTSNLCNTLFSNRAIPLPCISILACMQALLLSLQLQPLDFAALNSIQSFMLPIPRLFERRQTRRRDDTGAFELRDVLGGSLDLRVLQDSLRRWAGS